MQKSDSPDHKNTGMNAKESTSDAKNSFAIKGPYTDFLKSNKDIKDYAGTIGSEELKELGKELLRRFDIRAAHVLDVSDVLKQILFLIEEGRVTLRKDENAAITGFKKANILLNMEHVPLIVDPPLKYLNKGDINGAVGACLRMKVRIYLNEIADKIADKTPFSACELYKTTGTKNKITEVAENSLRKGDIRTAARVSVNYNIDITKMFDSEEEKEQKMTTLALVTLYKSMNAEDEFGRKIAIQNTIKTCNQKELLDLAIELIHEKHPKLALFMCKTAGMKIPLKLEQEAEYIESGKMAEDTKNNLHRITDSYWRGV